MHTKIKQPEPNERYKPVDNWCTRSEEVLRKWLYQGKLLSLTDGKPLKAATIDKYFCELFGLITVFTGDEYYVARFYKQLNNNEIQIEWLFGPHAYTIYKMMVLQRLEEKHD